MPLNKLVIQHCLETIQIVHDTFGALFRHLQCDIILTTNFEAELALNC